MLTLVADSEDYIEFLFGFNVYGIRLLKKFATAAFHIGVLNALVLWCIWSRLNGLGMTCTFADVKSWLASIQNWLPVHCILSAIVLDQGTY